MKYFEVFYPDGNKGIFGYMNNITQNHLSYPLTSLTDLKGNKIGYSYIFSNNHYYITYISYNGGSIEFKYQTSRPDPILYFSGGLKVYEPQLLQSITCKVGLTVLGTYTLKYSTQNNKSILTQIDFAASGKSYNPLLFYYGTGNIASNYTKSTTQLYEWYVADNPSMIKVAKGKFDYNSGADGLISLPNLNPYWKHYRHSTMFRHSQNRFDNMYTGEEKIFLYAGLKDNLASPMPNLFTEKGFVNIICADLEGKQEEYVIKINNSVDNNNDQVIFNVYRSNLYSGLSKLYTRTYNFPTVYTDADGGKSIQPKFYYTGDFNGDGKMEVLAISVHQPFGDTGKPSICYIFDLVNNRILYQNHVLPYNVEFVGTQQSDPKAASNNTDKLFVMDYDGDGKTDICHINENGVNIYTFDVSGSTLTPRKVATYTGLKKSELANRDVLLGEFNGDGLIDLLVSPTGTSTTWTMYNSKGNGQFESSSFNGTTKNTADNTGFITQDINGDGFTDLVKYDTSGFFTYIAKNNNVGSSTLYSSYPSSKSVLVPTDINTHNCFTQLISLKDGIATKYSFSYVNIKRPTHKVGQVYTKIDIKPSVLTKERLALMKTQMRLLYDDK